MNSAEWDSNGPVIGIEIPEQGTRQQKSALRKGVQGLRGAKSELG